MSIPTTLHPILVLDVAHRPAEGLLRTAPTSLLMEMYEPIIRQQRVHIPNLPQGLVEHVLRATFSAWRVKEDATELSFFSDLVFNRTQHLDEQTRTRVLTVYEQKLRLWDIFREVYPQDIAWDKSQWQMLDFVLSCFITDFTGSVLYDFGSAADMVDASLSKIVAQETWAYICQHADPVTMPHINLPAHLLDQVQVTA